MAFEIKITDAGRAEVVAAIAGGDDPVELTEVAFGTGQYTPDGTETSLLSETKRLSTITGIAADPQTLHLTIKDESTDGYIVNEFGLFTDAGTLFAIYSHISDTAIEKSANTSLLLSLDIALSTVDAATLTFGDLSFINPPATQTVAGIMKLATPSATEDGTEDDTAVTPKSLKTELNKKLNTAQYTAENIRTKLKTVHGAGSGIDADLLDGEQGNKYALLASPKFTGDPEAPTQAADDNSTKISNTAYADRAVKNFVDGAKSQTLVQAWLVMNGTGTITILDSFNISSIVDHGTGDYSANYINAMPNANYGVLVSVAQGPAGGLCTGGVAEDQARTTGSVRFYSKLGDASYAARKLDNSLITVIIFASM